MTTRRRFVEIVPLAGVALLAACSDKAPPPAPAPVAAPAPTSTSTPAAAAAPAPAPAPAAEAPAAAPVAANTTPVNPAEPSAMALGYVSDAAKADSAKFKTYTAGQSCSNCALFGGKAGDASGPCPLSAGRAVNAKGWCSGHAKRAA